MRKYKLLTIAAVLVISAFSNCDKNEGGNPSCHPIIKNEPFIARIGETWCLPGDALEITFGPVIEDSRCNVPNIECVWAGRFVEGTTLYNGAFVRDTFRAENGWRDTLYSDPYSIILNKVIPETRQTMEMLPDSKYSLEVIVK